MITKVDRVHSWDGVRNDILSVTTSGRFNYVMSWAVSIVRFHMLVKVQLSKTRNLSGLENQHEVLPEKQNPGALFYTQTEGFQVNALQFANEAAVGGCFAKKKFDEKEFLKSYWVPRSSTNLKLRLCNEGARRETSCLH